MEPTLFQFIVSALGILSIVVSAIYLVIKSFIDEKAKQWNEIYGNTDFENPYAKIKY